MNEIPLMPSLGISKKVKMLILGQLTQTFQNMKFKAHPQNISLHFVVSRRQNFNIT